MLIWINKENKENEPFLPKKKQNDDKIHYL